MRSSAPQTAPPTAAGDEATPTATNPIDDARFFVRQHYLDFLNREPDAPGLAFWANQITACGADAKCVEARRVNVSAAFFLSIEFQETGFFAYKSYKAAFGDTGSPTVPGTVPIIKLHEFLPDAQRIGLGVRVGVGAWEKLLSENKDAYVLEFVQRPRFTAAFPASLTAAQFVDRLDQRAGGVLTAGEKAQLAASLGSTPADARKRAAVLRRVAEDADLHGRETNRAFVLMQYYGYLRRNPNDGGNQNFGGWRFWLDKLNRFGGNFVAAEMVKAFIISLEYKSRFGTQAVAVTPDTAQTGKTVTVNITGQFTSFIKNITRARFGDGVSVGGAAAGAFGPVNVIDKTHATAQVTVAGSAAQGLRSVTLETVAERVVLNSGFTISAFNPLVVSADADRTAGALGTTFTFTGRVVESPSPVAQWQWTLSDGRKLTGRSISVSFPAPGPYGAQLTATDQDGNVVQAETGVMVFDPTTQAPAELGLPKQVGDVDGDGQITLTDAHMASKHAGRLELLPADAAAAADIDLDQQVTPDDARLLGQAVAAGEPLPSALLPARGAPGARVTLISPALLDPTADIEIGVGQSQWVQQPLRLVRGYAAFVIPFDATRRGSMRVTPGPVEVRIINNGAVVDTLTFQVVAPPPLPANPKAELRKLLDDYAALFQINHDAVRQLLDEAAVDGPERELLLAAFTTAREDVTAKLANMRQLLDAPGGDQLARLFFLYANANGYPELRQSLTEVMTSGVPALQSSLTAAAATGSVDEILNAICEVKKAAKTLSTASDLFSTGCDLLLIAALAAVAVPADGPLFDAAAMFTWVSVCGTVETTMEMGLMLLDFVDKLDANIRLKASTTAPQAGEKVELRATLEVVGIDDLCSFGVGQAKDKLVEEVGRRAVKRLMRRKLALKAIGSAIGYIAPKFIIDLENRLGAALARAINNTAVGEALSEFSNKVCGVLHAGVPIDYELNETTLQGPNPNVGVRTFPGGGIADYVCPAQGSSSADNVTFTVSRDICGKTEKVEVTISCRSRPVTITIGDNGSANDDIYEVRIKGQTVLTSSVPVRSISTTVNLAAGDHTVEMIGRAAPDGIGTYFIQFSGATVVGGAPLSGDDLTPGVVKTFTIRVQ
ncbi:MAG TPA: PKD domain-containing protein [Pyrinomonadaceae bacterium]|nr:PKD domain-containing protein [Pyrinomonadaceae bacterium]